jgi:FkbM family methyltransferase
MTNNPLRPIPFILASTNHGTMIINRNDHNGSCGVGFQLLSTSSFDSQEISLSLELLNRRRFYFGDGLFVLDCGANIGTHSLEWGRHMYGWGNVLAFEPQEIVYYALAGNIVINNCMNVRASNCAVGSFVGSMGIPKPDYLISSSYGSLEMKYRQNAEFIGQKIDYNSLESSVSVLTIDSLDCERLDLVKLDIEGMEMDALEGARRSLESHKPILIVEMIKSNANSIIFLLKNLGYVIFNFSINILAIHQDDPVLNCIEYENGIIRMRF